jgi:hypothetical protein
MSHVAWIVGSFQEREEALALLQNDEPVEPRDHLGIGPLRDALGRVFFPGVTTQHRGAKYFLLVTRMYGLVERERRRTLGPERQIRSPEQSFLDRLHSEVILGRIPEDGIIGSRSWRVPERSVSDIYWTGTYVWGLRRFPWPRGAYHAMLRAGGLREAVRISEDDPLASEPLRREPPEAELLLSAPDGRRAAASRLW